MGSPYWSCTGSIVPSSSSPSSSNDGFQQFYDPLFGSRTYNVSNGSSDTEPNSEPSLFFNGPPFRRAYVLKEDYHELLEESLNNLGSFAVSDKKVIAKSDKTHNIEGGAHSTGPDLSNHKSFNSVSCNGATEHGNSSGITQYFEKAFQRILAEQARRVEDPQVLLYRNNMHDPGTPSKVEESSSDLTIEEQEGGNNLLVISAHFSGPELDQSTLQPHGGTWELVSSISTKADNKIFPTSGELTSIINEWELVTEEDLAP